MASRPRVSSEVSEGEDDMRHRIAAFNYCQFLSKSFNDEFSSSRYLSKKASIKLFAISWELYTSVLMSE